MKQKITLLLVILLGFTSVSAQTLCLVVDDGNGGTQKIATKDIRSGYFQDGKMIVTGNNGGTYTVATSANTTGSFAVTNPTGIEPIKVEAVVKAYPNPVQYELNIQNTDGKPIGNVTVRDMSGRVLYKTQSGSSYLAVDFSAYSKGIYLVSVGAETMKVVKK